MKRTPALFLSAALLLGVPFLYAASRPAPPAPAAPPSRLVEEVPLPLALFRDDTVTVVLDPGHGGVQTGACYFGAEESAITLAVVDKLKPMLEARGYRVLLTREDDTDVDLYDRAAFANGTDAALFLSVHANASDGHPQIRGVMTYIQSGKESGRPLGEAIHARLLSAADGGDYGVQEDNLAVLRETTMPAALAEIGFMSNEAELKQLLDEAYQEKIAQALADGIGDYLSAQPA